MWDRVGRDGLKYHRVKFFMKGGGHAMTDIVPSFRNWKHWRKLLASGNALKGLHMINETKVDADSKPVLIATSCYIPEIQENKNQMSLGLD